MRLGSPPSGRSHSPPYSLFKTICGCQINLSQSNRNYIIFYAKTQEMFIHILFFAPAVLFRDSPINFKNRKNCLISTAISYKQISVCGFSTLPDATTSISHQAFAVNVTFGFVVCVFIWILVCFRRKDWTMIISRRKNIKNNPITLVLRQEFTGLRAVCCVLCRGTLKR